MLTPNFQREIRHPGGMLLLDHRVHKFSLPKFHAGKIMMGAINKDC